jgi:thiosulfate/3-mercaptopyruvate sulfurtransferase
VAANRDWLVVDTRPLKDYEAGHLPGAVPLEADSLSEIRDGVKGLLKPLPALRDALSKAGIDPKRRVILYSDMVDSDKRTQATRLFWILDYLGYPQLSVLDGGINEWTADKRPVDTGAPVFAPVTLPEFKPNGKRLSTAEAVQTLLASKTGVLLDNRPSAQFAGDNKKDFVARAGHIAGACSLPHDDFTQPETGLFKPQAELKTLLEKRGITGSTPFITYCNTGRMASVGYFVARFLGYDNVSLYDGSMADWAHREQLPVSLGKTP